MKRETLKENCRSGRGRGIISCPYFARKRVILWHTQDRNSLKELWPSWTKFQKQAHSTRTMLRNTKPKLLYCWIYGAAGWRKRQERKNLLKYPAFGRKNLLGDLNQVGKIIENNGETQTYSGTGAYCFYIEVDGDCTVTFTENGSPLSGKYTFNGGEETEFNGTINITVPEGTSAFYPLKGILNATGGNVTMTITGELLLPAQ